MTALRLPVRRRPGPGRTGPLHAGRLGRKSAGSRLHLSCQNGRMTAHPPGSQPEALSRELAACRKRGIERLDVRTHNQSPVPLPGLQQLADEYRLVTGNHTTSRIAQLKYLLRDAIGAFEAENEADAQLVKRSSSVTRRTGSRRAPGNFSTRHRRHSDSPVKCRSGRSGTPPSTTSRTFSRASSQRPALPRSRCLSNSVRRPRRRTT